MWQVGPQNNICDVSGFSVGHAEDERAQTGTTVIVFDRPTTASVSILGQAPGTRDMAALDPARTVDAIDALVLSGGSAFGLSAADPVMAALGTAGRGFAVGDVRVPIVPAAILFDLANGGPKPSDLGALYRELGQDAFAACNTAPAHGRFGAGYGATTGAGANSSRFGSAGSSGQNTGGMGMASTVFDATVPEPLRGKTVAALVAINAVGSPFMPDGQTFRASPFELNAEFGGRTPRTGLTTAPAMKTLSKPGQNTTIGMVATDAALNKRGCHNLAIAGQDGIAAAIFPAHTTLDGDLVVAASLGQSEPLHDPLLIALLQTATTATMARAIARGVFAAMNG